MTTEWTCIDAATGGVMQDVVKVDGLAMVLERYVRGDDGSLVGDAGAGLLTETLPLESCVFDFAPSYRIVVRLRA